MINYLILVTALLLKCWKLRVIQHTACTGFENNEATSAYNKIYKESRDVCCNVTVTRRGVIPLANEIAVA